MEYETIIGLEVHAQLLTRSKMYCRCSSDYASAPPNTHVCPVCMGMPGVLPTLNRQAIEYVMMTALALNCGISAYSKFDRKNYPYPDLMKGYQISQYDAPIGNRGWMNIEADGVKKKAGITRVHLEEDVAKMIHHGTERGGGYSLVDVNRAGVPLMEIVGEPDLRSPEEARQYLIKLRSILQYLGVSTGNMEEGSFRCDANISIRPLHSQELMPKVEVKNMNSFRAVARALEYEAKRQRVLVEEGGVPEQETRGWVEEEGRTVSQRSKEHAHDYRYFPEPDLPPLNIEPAWVEKMRALLPELPEARRDRFMSQYGLPLYDANLLTETRAMAEYYERCFTVGDASPVRAKAISNWMLGEFTHLLNATGSEIASARVEPGELSGLIDALQKGSINNTSAKTVFEEMFRTGKSASEIIKQQGLSQITDSREIEAAVERVIADNPQPAADYRVGKTQAMKFLVGQVMKATRGRANATQAQELLVKKIEGN
ncbi:MAG: Asp-tRNA(Asn)/Glu-tRNA(Gln) amidotransferase subunit GatB [Dehalococcoidales bacterium]|nr:Asp-tRNA(Asn)/Glu-tRNA(Gln) amidotransferase subunit GatB [Dehalococcoidales bacterium]